MSTQKSLKQFFKPLNSGGVKRTFSELTGNSQKSANANEEVTKESDAKNLLRINA